MELTYFRMPLFAAGAAAPDAVAKYSDKKSASFEGSIDPMTMLAVIRAQNESEEKIKSDLIDPIIDMTGSDKESFKIWILRVESSAQYTKTIIFRTKKSPKRKRRKNEKNRKRKP